MWNYDAGDVSDAVTGLQRSWLVIKSAVYAYLLTYEAGDIITVMMCPWEVPVGMVLLTNIPLAGVCDIKRSM